MDEPLSNLDAKLRVAMRAEVTRIQRLTGVTTIYVTHDQTEAMTMGDRVAVLDRGVLQQLDTPKMLYQRPANLFVAGFIGSPAMNLIACRVYVENGAPNLLVEDQRLRIPAALCDVIAPYAGRDMVVGIRPEHFFLAREDAQPALQARITLVEELGATQLVHLSTREQAQPVVALTEDERGRPMASGLDLLASLDPEISFGVGDVVTLGIAAERLHFFDPDSGAAVRARVPQVQ
jgi:multiple sugar transport system ATP-binding protein